MFAIKQKKQAGSIAVFFFEQLFFDHLPCRREPNASQNGIGEKVDWPDFSFGKRARGGCTVGRRPLITSVK